MFSSTRQIVVIYRMKNNRCRYVQIRAIRGDKTYHIFCNFALSKTSLWPILKI